MSKLDNVSTEQKAKLRQVRDFNKKGMDQVRWALQNGLIEQGAYIQFSSDLALYGLWEALLMAANYERDGYYRRGTAAEALEKALLIE